jgi:2-polyprenyl-3-methyl-5-hydroxy-6-metoxy-1,4-benzoquinol methylase
MTSGETYQPWTFGMEKESKIKKANATHGPETFLSKLIFLYAIFYLNFIKISILRNKAFSDIKSGDVGCAKGYLVKMLREKKIEAYGVDV